MFFRGTAIACLLATGTLATPLYEVTVLPILAYDMNDAGTVVGRSGNPQVPTVWENGTTTPLAAYPGFTPSLPMNVGVVGINESGTVVAQVSGTPIGGGGFFSEARAVLYSSYAAIPQDLGHLPGSRTTISSYPFSAASDINESGVIIGFSYDSGTTLRPVIYDGLGGVTQVSPANTHQSSPIGISDLGYIVGPWGSGNTKAALSYLGGNPATLPPAAGDVGTSFRLGISRDGRIAGLSLAADGGETVVEWNTADSPLSATVRGSYPGAYLHQPTKINNAGQIIGTIFRSNSNADRFAFLLDGNTFYDLNDCLEPSSLPAGVVVLSGAGVINNNGWIIASGTLDGASTSFLLKPAAAAPPTPPVVLDLPASGTGNLTILSETGKTYQLLESTDPEGGFSPTGAAIPGDGSELSFPVSVDAEPSRYWRVLITETP